MLIAIMSDIHGNSKACEAVLNEAKELGVEKLFVLGDLVGYYYRPDEVLTQLRGWPFRFLRGNHETLMRESQADESAALRIEEEYGHGIRQALKVLPKKDVDFLAGAPRFIEETIDGAKLFFCHGAPWEEDFYIYPDAPEEVLARVCQQSADFVFMGHTHHPFVHSRNGVTAVNVGSVGQPRDFGGFASWATLDTKRRVLIFRRTQFEISSLVEEARRFDPERNFLEDVLSRRSGKKRK